MPDQPLNYWEIRIDPDLRYAGETIRYRIYYRNNSRQQTDTRIIDRLDNGLEQINVFNNGSHIKSENMIVWEINDVPAETGGFVEFEAKLGTTDMVRNQALIQIGPRKLLEKHDPGQPITDTDKIIAKPAKRISDLSKVNEIKTNTVITKICTAPQLGWIPFDRVATEDTSPSAALKEETTMGTMVRFDIPGLYAQEIKVDGVTFHRLAVPRHTTLLDLGKPELPIVGQIIEIPKDVNFTLEIVQSKSHILDYYNVYPAQEPIDRTGTGVPKKFVQDAAAYTADALYPVSLATVEARDVGIIRGHRVVFLKANPVQFNPVTRKVIGYSMIEIRVKFDRPAQIERAPSRVESAAFEQMLKASVLNYKEPLRLTPKGHHSEEGVDYLILTDSSFYTAGDANNPLNRLAAWKRQKGLTTRIVDGLVKS